MALLLAGCGGGAGDGAGDELVGNGTPDGTVVPPGVEISESNAHTAIGVVTWHVTGPNLEQPMEVAWSLSLERTQDLPVTSRLIRGIGGSEIDSEPLGRTDFDIRGTAKLSIADLDGDGTEHILVAGNTLYEMAWTGNGFEQVWEYPFAMRDGRWRGRYAVTSGDIDGDGQEEIFLSTGSGAVRFDGVLRTESANSEAGSGAECVQMEVSDLEGDGEYELVCLRTPLSSGGFKLQC